MDKQTDIEVGVWIITFIICSFLWATRANAEIGTDKFAHFAMSYTGNAVLYGFNKKALKMDRVPALFVSSFTMMILGMAKEALDPQADRNDLIANSLGQAAFVGSCLLFDF